MLQQHSDRKTRSHTVPTQEQAYHKSLCFQSKTGEILRVESQIRKLKHLLSMQKQLEHNHSEYQKITAKINQFEEELKVKRKQAIAQKLQLIESRKQERVHSNKEANQLLNKIKEEQRRRRQKLESIVNMYKQEYDLVYEKNLKKRRQQMKFDLQEIKNHQSHYLKVSTRRPSLRVKTENSEGRPINSRCFSPGHQELAPQKGDETIKRLKQLAKRRKDYGQWAQKNASKVKISMEMVRKGKNYKHNGGFQGSVDSYQEKKRQMHKPKLNTNLSGDKEVLQKREIHKIVDSQTSPVKDKLAILQNLANRYKVKFDNGDTEALGKVCDINLRRAQLFLQDI